MKNTARYNKKTTLLSLRKLLKDNRDYEIAEKMINLFSFDKILLVCLTGSHAHGTNTPKSDYDIKIIYKLPKERFVSIYKAYDGIEIFREQKDLDQKYDKVNNANGNINEDAHYVITDPKIQYVLQNNLIHSIKYERNNSDNLIVDVEMLELNHYVKQLHKCNSNSIEILHLPEECILYMHESFKLLVDIKEKFITKESEYTFLGYAYQQLKKMEGENKKFRVKKEDMKIKKTPLDFIKVLEDGNEIPLNEFLKINEYEQKFCGLVQLPHNHNKLSRFIKYHADSDQRWIALAAFLERQLQALALVGNTLNVKKITSRKTLNTKTYTRIGKVFQNITDNSINGMFKFLSDRFVKKLTSRYQMIYAMFYDVNSEACFSEKITIENRTLNKTFYKGQFKGYKGIVKEDEEGILTSNELRLSSIPKNEKLVAIITYDMNAYSEYSRNYKEYWKWDKNKNNDRYQMNLNHGQGLDSKNASHLIRILDTYKEILETGKMRVKREDKRDHYLEIKQGKLSYDAIINEANLLNSQIIKLYKKANFLQKMDYNEINDILLKIRNYDNKQKIQTNQETTFKFK